MTYSYTLHILHTTQRHVTDIVIHCNVYLFRILYKFIVALSGARFPSDCGILFGRNDRCSMSYKSGFVSSAYKFLVH